MTRTDGEQCEATTREGDRCLNRAFALVGVHGPDGDKIREVWLCGAHQRKACPAGGMIRLVRKWARAI